MDILRRDNLPLGGFAGLKEHRLVMDPKAWGKRTALDTWPGIGNFVYLADARFLPKGETTMHDHKEVDVISVMVEGRIAHEGTLGHGSDLSGKDVQVQRAGGEGFSHNEINPDDTENRMIQLWVLPEASGQPAGYKHYGSEWGKVTRVYGGASDQDATIVSHTLIDVALLKPGQSVTADGPYLAYVTQGAGRVEDNAITDGDLVRGSGLAFEASEDTQLIIVHLMQ